MKALAQRVEIRLYTPGDLLMTIGEVGTELFIVGTGSVVPLGPNGEYLVDTLLGPGSFFGELCFLNPGSRRTASVRCLEFCRAMVLTIDAFQELNLSDVILALREEGEIRFARLESGRRSTPAPSDGRNSVDTFASMEAEA